LVAGYAAITGMRIAEHKLRTYHVRGWQDDLRQPASDKGLWIHDSHWKATCGSLSKKSIASRVWGYGMIPRREISREHNWN